MKKNAEESLFKLIPVKVEVDDDAHTSWEVVDKSNILLFTRNPDQDFFNEIMGEAVNGLLRSIPVEYQTPG